MKINFLPFLLLASFVFAQEDPEQLVNQLLRTLIDLLNQLKKLLHLDLLKIMQDCKDF